jgi:hypothetical protein
MGPNDTTAVNLDGYDGPTDPSRYFCVRVDRRGNRSLDYCDQKVTVREPLHVGYWRTIVIPDDSWDDIAGTALAGPDSKHRKVQPGL